MALKMIKVLFALMAISIIACDYTLSEEEQAEIDKEPVKEDFMKNFACLVGTQRFMQDVQNLVNEFSRESNFLTRSKKLITSVFKKCIDTISDEEKALVGAAKSKEDFDNIRLKGLSSVNVVDILSTDDATLDAESSKLYQKFIALEKQIREIQKNNMRENPEVDDDYENLTAEAARRAKGKSTKIGSLDMASPVVRFAVLIFMTALAGFAYLLYQRLSVEEQTKKKRRRSSHTEKLHV